MRHQRNSCVQNNHVSSAFFLAVFVACWSNAIFAQTTAPVGSLQNPKQITSKDLGPDIDPVKLTASKYNCVPLFRSFRSFASGSYAIAGVWVYAANDEQAIYDTPATYYFPSFYSPTWGEVFDHIGWQMGCDWKWDPANRQFRFGRSQSKPFFGVTLANGWRTENRSGYVWYAPKDQDFGMDIYYFGHYTADPKNPGLMNKVRFFFTLQIIGDWPNVPQESDMKTVNVDGTDALYVRLDTPRPGGLWRQWSFVNGGHAFLIVSAMPKENEAKLAPDVDKMVASFKMETTATQPTTAPAK